MLIEKREPPPRIGRNGNKWREVFDRMQPGDSFYFDETDANPQSVITMFAMYLAKGRYSLRKEGNGYRFYLVK